MVCGVLGKVVQSNARFVLTDRLEVHLGHVGMPGGNGREKTKGRSLDVMGAIKKCIVTVKATFLFLAQALIIAVARVNGEPKYKSYRNDRGLKQPVQDLLNTSGDNLTNGSVFKELELFQNYLFGHKIIAYDGLSPDRVLFSVNSLSNKKFYLLYDSGHFNVITNLKAAMAKRYICNALTHCTTIHTSVTKLDPCVRRNNPVLKIGQSIVLHATGDS